MSQLIIRHRISKKTPPCYRRRTKSRFVPPITYCKTNNSNTVQQEERTDDDDNQQQKHTIAKIPTWTCTEQSEYIRIRMIRLKCIVSLLKVVIRRIIIVI